MVAWDAAVLRLGRKVPEDRRWVNLLLLWAIGRPFANKLVIPWGAGRILGREATVDLRLFKGKPVYAAAPRTRSEKEPSLRFAVFHVISERLGKIQEYSNQVICQQMHPAGCMPYKLQVRTDPWTRDASSLPNPTPQALAETPSPLKNKLPKPLTPEPCRQSRHCVGHGVWHGRGPALRLFGAFHGEFERPR